MPADSPILKPIYRHSPNEPISLGVEEAEVFFQKEKKRFPIQGEIKVHFLPSPSVKIHCHFPSPEMPFVGIAFNGDGNAELHFPNRGIKAECLLTKIGMVDEHSRPSMMTAEFQAKNSIKIYCGVEQEKISSVVFHLSNFSDFYGSSARIYNDGNTSNNIFFFVLDGGDWQIEISHHIDSKKAIDTLKEEGGYAITHVGCLKKPNGTRFSGKEAEECLHMLRFFLSFARGAWVSPILSVGFDEFGSRVWEQWNSPFGEPWGRGLSSWFDNNHSEQLIESFPGFARRWQDEKWKRAIRESISWYVNANSSPIFLDARIILTQTAIERLSYEYAVESEPLGASKRFKKMCAADKFRSLFLFAGLPINVPDHLINFKKEEKEFDWKDAPDALTKVRNSIVHPDHICRGQFSSILSDTWRLGLWYLELTILRLLGYSGTYRNRLVRGGWSGTVETVPWVKGKG